MAGKRFQSGGIEGPSERVSGRIEIVTGVPWGSGTAAGRPGDQAAQWHPHHDLPARVTAVTVDLPLKQVGRAKQTRDEHIDRVIVKVLRRARLKNLPQVHDRQPIRMCERVGDHPGQQQGGHAQLAGTKLTNAGIAAAAGVCRPDIAACVDGDPRWKTQPAAGVTLRGGKRSAYGTELADAAVAGAVIRNPDIPGGVDGDINRTKQPAAGVADGDAEIVGLCAEHGLEGRRSSLQPVEREMAPRLCAMWMRRRRGIGRRGAVHGIRKQTCCTGYSRSGGINACRQMLASVSISFCGTVPLPPLAAGVVARETPVLSVSGSSPLQMHWRFRLWPRWCPSSIRASVCRVSRIA